MTMDIKTPLEMLYQWARKTPDKVFLGQPKALQWNEYTKHVSVAHCPGPLAFELQGAS
jgi:hypothetical protein